MTEPVIRRTIFDRGESCYLWLACWDDAGYHFRIERPSALDTRVLLAWECRMVLRRSCGLADLAPPELGCADTQEDFHATEPEHARSFLIREQERALDPHATELFRDIERHRKHCHRTASGMQVDELSVNADPANPGSAP